MFYLVSLLCLSCRDTKCQSIEPGALCVRLRLPPVGPAMCLRPENRDVHVVGSIRRHGLWEAGIATQFYAAIRQHPSAVVLDIGAHLGQYTLIAAAAGAQVIAFEANPDNAQYLRASLSMNKLSNVKLTAQPAMHQSGIRMSFVSAVQRQQHNNLGGWSVARSTDGPLLSTTVDEVIATNPEFANKSYIMKIDIEGNEPSAIAGATRVMAGVMVNYMEWGPNPVKPEKIDMARSLEAMGLSVTDSACRNSRYLRCPWDVMWTRPGFLP